MAKSVNPGELRTAVFFKRIQRVIDPEGYYSEEEINVRGQDAEGNDIPFRCYWNNAHGSEVFEGMQLQLRNPATLTMRYTPLVDITQVVYKRGDPDPYEIISVNDVEDRHRWLEVRVQRKVVAR